MDASEDSGRPIPVWGGLFADLAIDLLANDVEVSDVSSVLLQQVEQHSLQGRGRRTFPAGTWSTCVSELVGLYDRPGALRLRVEGCDEPVQGLGR